jgi:hypothetical protein
MARKSHSATRAITASLVLVLVAAACGTNKEKTDASSTSAPTATTVSCNSTQDAGIPITFAQAKAGSCEGDFDWGDTCDLETGRLTLPSANPLDCVPAFTGENGNETSPGVTADTIKVARYRAEDDPATAAFLNSIGARDEPEDVASTYDSYLELFNRVAQTYGRTVEVTELQATGSATDAVAARADALTAADMGVFAVIGGPAQTRAFSEELSRQKIINIGGGVGTLAFYKKNSPYIWPGGPGPEQTALRTTEFITKQLVGKKAEFAGDALKDQERTFVLLTYDDAESNFKEPWDTWLADLQAKGVPVADERIVFTLDLARAAEDTQTVVRALKEVNATTVVFTGDPIMPAYFSSEMTKQNYFPEWVLSGTVFADTTVLARGYDPEQWKHAMGISLIPARIPRDQSDSIILYKWWTGVDPPAENTAAIIAGNVSLLFAGIHFAGPDLTPESFRAGIFARPIPARDAGGLRATVTYGKSDFWEPDTDYAGLDDVAIIWWDPTGEGEDETGDDESVGQYRYVNGGQRFLPGEIPDEPLNLFDPEGSLTYFSDEPDAPEGTLPVPDDLKTDINKYEKPA